jgi:hypothetical protein
LTGIKDAERPPVILAERTKVVRQQRAEVMTKRYWTFDQVMGRERLMEDMMETCDVDALSAVREGGGLAFSKAHARCQECRHENECREWLKFTPVAEWGAPDFCANGDFFARHCRKRS